MSFSTDHVQIIMDITRNSQYSQSTFAYYIYINIKPIKRCHVKSIFLNYDDEKELQTIPSDVNTYPYYQLLYIPVKLKVPIFPYASNFSLYR